MSVRGGEVQTNIIGSDRLPGIIIGMTECDGERVVTARRPRRGTDRKDCQKA